MQRETISRRSALSLAAGCAVTSIGVATVSGGADEGVTRDSFAILEGTDRETTVYVTSADAEGPTVVVTGGVHGNEVAGYVAAGGIADWTIDAGTLVVIPETNAVAIERGTRTDDDGVDLNRQFPEGTAPRTELARAVWNVVSEYDPDVVVDLHESTGIYAGDPVDGVGQAIFTSSDDDAVAAAMDATDYVNANYVDDPAHAFQTGPFSSPNSNPQGLLVHKSARDLDAEAFLVETLSTDIDLDTRVQWHSAIVERLVEDELFTDAPENEHGADEEPTEPEEPVDEEPTESDEPVDESGDENADAGGRESPTAKIRTVPANAEELALEAGQTVELDASCSCAPDGEIVRYEWDVGRDACFDDTGETIEVTIGANGRDSVVLRVVDDAEGTDTESITLSAN